MRVGRQPVTDIQVFEMKLSKFRMRLRCIVCLAAVAGVLAGCGSGAPASTSTTVSTPQSVKGIATPSSVAVVTATH
jgi:ABC-type uncharacterized transport system auxiliary subunit